MSRIGKRPVPIPDKVEVKLTGRHVVVKGPKGTLERELHPASIVKIEGNEIVIERGGEGREDRAVHGLTRSLVANMVKGVSEGFKRSLEINGIGYKVESLGSFLRFDLGYSHPILYQVPEGLTAEVEKRGVAVSLSGADKEVLGAAVATIRGFRPPEPYKGKGIKYVEEVIQRKVGKAGGR